MSIATEAATVCEAFQAATDAYRDRIAWRTKDDEVSVTWGEAGQRVRKLAAGFADMGVQRGDTFALMLVNRPEFHLADTAAMHLGATCFSIYNTLAPDQIAYLLGDARPKALVTEKAFADQLRAAGAFASVPNVVLVDDEGGLEAVEQRAKPDFDFDGAWRAVAPDDVLTLIYTSGTTGPPKGVQLTHRNQQAEARALPQVAPYPDHPTLVSYLPLAHIAERGLIHYLGMAIGSSVTCCPDPRELAAHLVATRPNTFGGVPRVWEKLKTGLELAFGGLPAPDRIEEARAMVGLEHVERAIGGAAAVPVEVLEYFDALGITILEVWGMSETSAVATINRPGAHRFGTVGQALPGVELRLEDDGELLVRGPIVMPGYRNLPEKTAEAFTDDGWLRTGDIGQIDDEGYLTIVDRKKELIINAAGKNMSPANIEGQLKVASPLIGQAYAHGDGRPYNVALIALDPDARAMYDNIDEEVARGVAAANEKLARVEQIKRWHVVEGDWLPGGDELTPTMKLKRKPIREKYADEIDELYAD
jgi:long-chain acyl-CoA synthetase